jgi:flagellin
MQVINTNVASLNAQRNLNNSQGALQTSLARLSSGLRINSAKDDAAGLAVSQRLGAQIKSLNQAMRNANDGISMLQTAEGAMDEMQNILTRMKELGTQAANGTIGSTERGFINTELVELRDEMQDIASRTNFNGQNLLTGSLSTSVNAGSTETNVGTTIVAGTSVTALDVSKAKAGTTFTFTNPSGANVTLSDGTNSQTVTVVAGTAGSTQTLDFSNLGIKLTLSSVSTETADNIAAGFAASGNDTIVTASGSGATNLQIGSGTAAGTDTVAISFADMRINNSTASQISTLATALTNFNNTQSENNARTVMSAVDGALDYFSTQRATLGALQNRMQSSVASTAVAAENLSAARSRVRDADFAAETSALTRGQILQQAGQAMLAQANALPQGVLQLLRG